MATRNRANTASASLQVTSAWSPALTGTGVFASTDLLSWGSPVVSAANSLITMGGTIDVSGVGGGITILAAQTSLVRLTHSSPANILLGTGGITVVGANLEIRAQSNAIISQTQNWNVSSGKSIYLNGLLAGSGALTFNGAGTVILDQGASSHSGGITISNGVTQVNASSNSPFTQGPLGTSTITMTGGKLSSYNTTGYTLANPLTLNGTMTLGDATNTGALTFTGAVTFSGTTSLTNASVVAFTGASAVNSGVTATINSDGGTSGLFRGTTTINGTLTVKNFNLFGASTNASAASVVINTGGTLTNSTNPYLTTLGALTLNGGTLTSAAVQTVGAVWTGAYIIRGAVTVTDTSTIGGTGAITFGSDVAPSTGSIDVSSGKTLTVSARIDNRINTGLSALQTLSLTKSGVGTLALTSSTSTFTGGLTVSAGTLQVGASSNTPITQGPLGTGTVTMNGGQLSSSSTSSWTIANALTLNGTMTLGDATTNTGVLTFSGTTTISGTSTLTLGSETIISGAVNGTGVNLTVAGAPLRLTSSAATGTFNGIFTTSGSLTTIGDYSSGTPNQIANASRVVITGGQFLIAGGNSYTFATPVIGTTGKFYVRNSNASGIIFTGDPGALIPNGFTGVFQLYADGAESAATAQLATFTLASQAKFSILQFSTYIGAAANLRQTWKYTGTSEIVSTSTIGIGPYTTGLVGVVDNSSSNASAVSFSGAVQLSGVQNGTLETTASLGNITLSGNITETVAFTLGFIKSGPFATTLSGANTFKGSVQVTAGTLNANSTTALGEATSTAAISVSSGAALSLGAALNYSSPGRTTSISGTGLTGVDAGCLILANSATMNLGAINAANNTYIRGTADGVTLSSNISWSGTGGLRLGAATGTTATFSGIISTTATMTATSFGRSNNPDFGTVVLSGNNTFSTTEVRIDYGTLSISSNSNLGAVPASPAAYLLIGNTSGGNGTLKTTASFTLSSNRGIALGPATGSGAGIIDVASSTTLTYSGIIANNSAGTGSLVKTGAGDLALGGVNTFSGSLSGDSGSISITGSHRNVSSVSATGTCAININVTNFLVSSHGVAVGSTRILSSTGSSSITFSSTTETRIGNVNLINGGTLTSNRALTWYDILLANTDLGASTITVSGTSSTAALINGTGGIHLQGVQNFDVSSVSLSGIDLDVSAVLADAGAQGGPIGGINKTGYGTMRLSGTNTFTGPTTISAGTIIATNSSSLGTSGLVTLTGTSTLTIGSVNVGRPIVVNDMTAGTVTLAANGSVALPTLSGSITLLKDLVINGSTNIDRFTLTGGISGTGNVIISGTGRVVFYGNPNTFSGNLTISSGSLLQIGIGTSLSSSYIPDSAILTINASGMLKLARGSTIETVAGLAGSGTVRSHEGVSGVSSVLEINSTTTNTFSGLLENGNAMSTLSIRKSGSGTQVISGTNTYSGGTIINGGVLSFGNGSLGSGNIQINGGTLQWGANNAQDVSAKLDCVTGGSATFDISNAFVNFNSPFVNNNSSFFYKTGTGGLTLGATGTFRNTTTVVAGSLFLGVQNAIDSGAAVYVGQATLDIGGFNQVNSNTVSLGSGSSILGNATYSMSSLQFTHISGTASVSAEISGSTGIMMTLGGDVTLNNENSYTGDTVITSGVLTTTVSNSLPGTTNLILNGGTINILDTNQTVSSVICSSGNILNSGTFGPGTLTTSAYIFNNSADFSPPFALSGSGYDVSMTGTGSLYATGNWQYTGDTIVSSGTIVASNVNGIPSSIIITGSGSLKTTTANNGVVNINSVFSMDGGTLVIGG